MDVGMMGHRRPPGVQDCGDADLGTQVLRVSGNGQHGVRGSLEQEVIDHRLVLVGDGGDLGGQREHDVKVRDLQELGLALFHPRKGLTALALRAVAIATTAVGYHRVRALTVLAARDIAAKRRRAAGLALITFNCAWLTCPRLAWSQADPKSRKISATSRAGRCTSAPGYFGSSPGRSGVNRSREVDAPRGRMNVANVLTRQM